PSLVTTVTIDGTSQPGYYTLAAISPANPRPVIRIDGSGEVLNPTPNPPNPDADNPNGLTLAAGSQGSTIKGLSISGFNKTNSTGIDGAGIEIQSDRNVIAGDCVGRCGYPQIDTKHNPVLLVSNSAI